MSLGPQDVDFMLSSERVDLTDDVRRFICHTKPFDVGTLALRQMVGRSLYAKSFFTYSQYNTPQCILLSTPDKVFMSFLIL